MPARNHREERGRTCVGPNKHSETTRGNCAEIKETMEVTEGQKRQPRLDCNRYRATASFTALHCPLHCTAFNCPLHCTTQRCTHPCGDELCQWLCVEAGAGEPEAPVHAGREDEQEEGKAWQRQQAPLHHNQCHTQSSLPHPTVLFLSFIQLTNRVLHVQARQQSRFAPRGCNCICSAPPHQSCEHPEIFYPRTLREEGRAGQGRAHLLAVSLSACWRMSRRCRSLASLSFFRRSLTARRRPTSTPRT